MEFDFNNIEEEARAIWREQDVYRAENDTSKPKYYVLDMFPYPSGAGLHVGHPLGYIASDIFARYKRLKGFNVLHPMGYDSFGLPAEQYAIQTGQHPAITAEENIKRFREQLDKMGFSFDWSRSLRTSDPDFYKWTQWIFLQLFKSFYNKKTDRAEPVEELIAEFEKNGNENVNAHCDQKEIFSAGQWNAFSEKEQQQILLNYRLAYIADSWVNWCPALGTVLANDEVKDGVSERGGYPVIQKQMKQWSLRITAYSERLLQGLEKINWSESIKETQRNWIGKSEGASVKFKVENSKSESAESFPIGEGREGVIEVFTTRPDTIFGCTFIVLAPENKIVDEITSHQFHAAVNQYREQASRRSERERNADVKTVSGQFTGAYAIHPFSKKQLPVYIADYVLATYGTGAVMAVPGGDQRDWRFAKHFNLPIIPVVKEPNEVSPLGGDLEGAYEGYAGKMINSDFLNGLEVKDAIHKVIDEIEKSGIGKGKIQYRQRDAIFGRQRYWGEPIPIYYKDGLPYPVDEDDLPIVLPEVDKYLPTEDGEPPLARAKSWTYMPHPNPPQRGGSFSPKKPGYQTAANSTWHELKARSREKRKNQTEAENVIWQYIRKGQIGYKIRRQHVIGNNIADFACLEKMVVIEIDGKYHDETKEFDEARTAELELAGFTVIRFTNEEVLEQPEEVAKKIKSELDGKVLPSGEDLGGAYSLETTTMPGWAGSNWYYLRYEDPNNENRFASKEAVDYWQNVDLYIGGDEHATGHLMYFRFCTKFLFDLGLIPFDEPAKKLVNQGKILGISQKILQFEKILSPKSIVYLYSEDEKQKGSFNLEDLEVEGNPELTDSINSLLKDIAIPSDFYSNPRISFYVSESMAPNKQNLNSHRIDAQLSKNSILDIKSFLKSQYVLKDSTKIFLTENGIWINDKFIRAKEGDSNFYTKTEVEKMSKSKYNVINPDDIISEYGADCLRMYEMFLGPLETDKPWDTKGIDGVYRFIKKLWRLFFDEEKNLSIINDENATDEELKILHRAIKKVDSDINQMSFNTSVSAFMVCVNELSSLKCSKKSVLKELLILLSPFAPFTTEFLWKELGEKESIVKAVFPVHNEKYIAETVYEYPVSVNGKVRAKISLDLNLEQSLVEKEVLALDAIQKWLNGNAPKKIIYVKGRMINLVI